METYAIVADNAKGEEFLCFHWRGDPDAGCEHARFSASEFGIFAKNIRARLVR